MQLLTLAPLRPYDLLCLSPSPPSPLYRISAPLSLSLLLSSMHVSHVYWFGVRGPRCLPCRCLPCHTSRLAFLGKQQVCKDWNLRAEGHQTQTLQRTAKTGVQYYFHDVELHNISLYSNYAASGSSCVATAAAGTKQCLALGLSSKQLSLLYVNPLRHAFSSV